VQVFAKFISNVDFPSVWSLSTSNFVAPLLKSGKGVTTMGNILNGVRSVAELLDGPLEIGLA